MATPHNQASSKGYGKSEGDRTGDEVAADGKSAAVSERGTDNG